MPRQEMQEDQKQQNRDSPHDKVNRDSSLNFLPSFGRLGLLNRSSVGLVVRRTLKRGFPKNDGPVKLLLLCCDAGQQIKFSGFNWQPPLRG